MVYVYYNITSNLTQAGNETTILTFVEGVNSMMNYFPATLMLIAIYLVLLFTLIGRDVDIIRATAATSFVSMILAIMLFPMNLIHGKTLIVFSVLCPVSIFILWVWGEKNV